MRSLCPFSSGGENIGEAEEILQVHSAGEEPRGEGGVHQQLCQRHLQGAAHTQAPRH